jgi:hypothetical protein
MTPRPLDSDDWTPWEVESLTAQERPTWQEALAGLALCALVLVLAVLLGMLIVVNVFRAVLGVLS